MKGWPLPVHLQVKSEAQAENMKLSLEFLKGSRSVRGKYGFSEVKEIGMTLGANPKAGMDRKEFAKYLFSSIVPLYPDASDRPGKRVASIVDSGPGRVNAEMLAKLRIRGFYLIPSVPNTTHVTQATDKNYGLFKSVYRENLSKLTEFRCSIKKSIRPTDIPVLIFGSQDEVDLRSAFEEAFAYKKNISIWAEIGLNPFNRRCLQDDKVKHEIVTCEDGTIDVDADPIGVKLQEIEDINLRSTGVLTAHGFNGSALQISAPRRDKSKTSISVTAPHSRERQDLLTKASTAGRRFYATGGEMLNSDDFFIAEERKERTDLIKQLKTKKSDWIGKNEQELEGKAVIEKYRALNKDVYSDDGAKTLDVSSLKTLYKWKYKKTPKAGLNKTHLLAAWNAAKDSTSNIDNTWTEEDQVELDTLENEEIKLSDTEVGR